MPWACIVSHEKSSQLLSLVLLPQESFRVFCSPLVLFLRRSLWFASVWLSLYLAEVCWVSGCALCTFQSIWERFHYSWGFGESIICALDGSFMGHWNCFGHFLSVLFWVNSVIYLCSLFSMLLRNILLFHCVHLDLQRNRRQRKCWSNVLRRSREETTGRGRRACGVSDMQWGGQIQEACGQAREPWEEPVTTKWTGTAPLHPAINREGAACLEQGSPKGPSFIAPHLRDPPPPSNRIVLQESYF